MFLAALFFSTKHTVRILTLEIIAKNLRKNSESFRSISISSVGTSTSFEIDLEAGSTKIENKHEFNGFRFKVPKDAKGA